MDSPFSSAPAGARLFRAGYRGRRKACPRLISGAPPGQGSGEGRNLSHTQLPLKLNSGLYIALKGATQNEVRYNNCHEECRRELLARELGWRN